MGWIDITKQEPEEVIPTHWCEIPGKP